MQKISYARYRFPPRDHSTRCLAIYFRFPLSYRDVEDLLAERGIDVLYGRLPMARTDLVLRDRQVAVLYPAYLCRTFACWP